MKIFLVIYNPLSGRRRKRQAWHALRKYLPEHTFQLARYDLHRQPLPDPATCKASDGIVVIGGDGTLRRVIQHCAEHDIRVPLAIIPRGSANLLARSLGLPFSLRKASRVIALGKIISVDIARANNHYFIGAFAAGYLSHRVTSVNQRLKNIVGFGGYFWSFLQDRKLPTHQFSFTVDGAEYAVDGHSIFIVNATNLFGFHPKRTTDFRDGMFELVVATNRSFWSLAALVFDFYFRHTPPKHFVLARGKKFTVKTTTIPSLQLDGEPLPPAAQVTITVLKQQQKFIVP